MLIIYPAPAKAIFIFPPVYEQKKGDRFGDQDEQRGSGKITGDLVATSQIEVVN
jgi:hypothetical protein